MRSHTLLRSFAVVGATTLLLGACGLGGKGGSAGEADRVTIASIMGAPEYEDFDYNAHNEKVQESVSTCMIAAGWEYIPVKYPDMNIDAEYADEEEIARIKREGIGIAYFLLNEGSGKSAPDDPWAKLVDPNADYVAGLSAAELDAYEGSLFGTDEEYAATTVITIDPATGEELIAQYGSFGCIGQVYEGLSGDNPIYFPKYGEAIKTYYEAVQQRVDADPRMAKLNEGWTKCIKEAGYEYGSQDEFWEGERTILRERTDAVLGPDFYKEPQPLTVSQQTQLEGVLADEVAVALAEHACSHDMAAKDMEISAEIEETYAIEHQDELEALALSLTERK